ncbi:MAG: hypothetical protein WC365_06510 [Candidatus Babeliales bacterium]|jgi:hypothetical protein
MNVIKFILNSPFDTSSYAKATEATQGERIKFSAFIYAMPLLLLFLFASCGKRYDLAHDGCARKAHLELAKHFDVPVPLGFTLSDSSCHAVTDGFSDFMRYSGSTASTAVIDFYKREMERAGWDITDLSTARDGFLYCSKPTKQCGIQIQQRSNNATTLSLFITQKGSR